MKAIDAIMALMDKDVPADDLGTILAEHGIDDSVADDADIEDVSWLDALPAVPTAAEKAKAELIKNNTDKVAAFDEKAAGTDAVLTLKAALRKLSLEEQAEVFKDFIENGKLPSKASDLIGVDTKPKDLQKHTAPDRRDSAPFKKGTMPDDPKDEGNMRRSSNILAGITRRK